MWRKSISGGPGHVAMTMLTRWYMFLKNPTLSQTITWSHTGPGRPARSCGEEVMISPSPPPPPSSSIAASSSTPLPHHHRQHHHGGGDGAHLGEPPRDAIVETAQTRKHLKYAGAENADKVFSRRKKRIHYPLFHHQTNLHPAARVQERAPSSSSGGSSPSSYCAQDHCQ